MENGKRNIERLTFFLVGGAVAAGVAFLVSPKSGRENRELIASKAKEGREFLESQIRRGREFVKKGREQASEQAADMAARAREAARGQAEKIHPVGEEGETPPVTSTL